MPEDPNWKMWTEMCLRELSQLRIDINRHLDEHRGDITRINDRMDSLNDKFIGLNQSLEAYVRDNDKRQDLALQELQIKAEAAGKMAGDIAGKEAGRVAGIEATKDIGSIAKSESAKYSMILTTILIGIAEFIRIYVMNGGT